MFVNKDEFLVSLFEFTMFSLYSIKKISFAEYVAICIKSADY